MSVQTDIDAAIADAARTAIGFVADVTIINTKLPNDPVVARGRGYQITSDAVSGYIGTDSALQPNQLEFFVSGILIEPKEGMSMTFNNKTYAINTATLYPGATSAYTLLVTRR